MYGKLAESVPDDKMITYKKVDKDGKPTGETGEMKASSAKRQKKDHPAKVEYDRLAKAGDKGGEGKPKPNIFDDPEKPADEPSPDKTGELGDEEGRFGIPDQDLKDTILQDLNPPRDSERDENGLPTNEEDWDKEMTEVESMYEKARDYYEDVARKAADAAFGEDEAEADYYADKEEEAEKEYNKYQAVRDAYEEKGQELGVYDHDDDEEEQSSDSGSGQDRIAGSIADIDDWEDREEAGRLAGNLAQGFNPDSSHQELTDMGLGDLADAIMDADSDEEKSRIISKAMGFEEGVKKSSTFREIKENWVKNNLLR